MRLSRALTFLILCALALGLVACGSGGSTTTDSSAGGTTAAGGTKERAQGEPKFTPRAHRDSGGGAQQFEAGGADNSIQEYGSEAAGSELADAAAVLHAYLDARAAGAWSAACQRLASAVSEELVRQLGTSESGEKAGCAEVLAALTSGLPASARRKAAIADVGALRVEGASGFLLFRGFGDRAFFIPVAREDGKWKVAAIAASPLP